MNPWLVRTILAVLALEAGICVAFLADAWPVLRHQEEALFETVLTATRQDKDFVLDEVQPVRRVRLVRPLEEGGMQPYLHVSVREESAGVLESLPPSPVDWHLLLKHMHEVGCKVAAVEQPMSWEGDDLYHLARLASLDSSLALFEIAILTVDLQRLPKNQPIPEYLRRSAIPLKNVRGELGALVRVNRVIHDPSATVGSHVRFSFRIQESVEEVTPEFVRWDDYLIPSFPLAVAMAQNNIPPDQVTVELGRHIRLGEGPIVPIDDIGQLKMNLIEKPQRAEIPAHLAVLRSEIPQARKVAGANVPRCALFTDASPDNPSPWADPNRLQRIVSSFDVLPHPGAVETHQRLALATELALLALIAVIAALVMGIRSTIRNISFLLLIVVALVLIVNLFMLSHKWTLFAPILATALAGWFLSSRMARYLPPRPQSATAD